LELRFPQPDPGKPGLVIDYPNSPRLTGFSHLLAVRKLLGRCSGALVLWCSGALVLWFGSSAPILAVGGQDKIVRSGMERRAQCRSVTVRGRCVVLAAPRLRRWASGMYGFDGWVWLLFVWAGGRDLRTVRRFAHVREVRGLLFGARIAGRWGHQGVEAFDSPDQWLTERHWSVRPGFRCPRQEPSARWRGPPPEPCIVPPAGTVGPLARASSRTLLKAQDAGPQGAPHLVPPAGFEPARMAPEATALSPELRGLGVVSTLSMSASTVSWQYLVRCAMVSGCWCGPAGGVSATHAHRTSNCTARHRASGAADATCDCGIADVGIVHS
jgi:hypothetical protein